MKNKLRFYVSKENTLNNEMSKKPVDLEGILVIWSIKCYKNANHAQPRYLRIVLYNVNNVELYCKT